MLSEKRKRSVIAHRAPSSRPGSWRRPDSSFLDREAIRAPVKAASIDRDRVRHALSGPVSGVHPPFHRDGSLDFDGLRREIEHNICAGSGTLLMTYWDGLHSLLTDTEVAEVLKAVVAQVRGRALVVAADRRWATGNEMAFADLAAETGADLLMVLP